MLALIHDQEGCFCADTTSQSEWRPDQRGNTQVFYTDYTTTHCHYANFMDPRRPFLPQIGVPSVPGAGNTWTRYLLERLTGVVAGSVFSDPKAIRQNIYGGLEPWDSNRSTFIKSHTIGRKRAGNSTDSTFQSSFLAQVFIRCICFSTCLKSLQNIHNLLIVFSNFLNFFEIPLETLDIFWKSLDVPLKV